MCVLLVYSVELLFIEYQNLSSVPNDKSAPKELPGLDWKSMLLELEDLEPVSTQLTSLEMIKVCFCFILINLSTYNNVMRICTLGGMY